MRALARTNQTLAVDRHLLSSRNAGSEEDPCCGSDLHGKGNKQSGFRFHASLHSLLQFFMQPEFTTWQSSFARVFRMVIRYFYHSGDTVLSQY